jgi:hypothetical protein
MESVTTRSDAGLAAPESAGWLALVGGVTVPGAAATVPVRRVLRMHPVEAIGLRE